VGGFLFTPASEVTKLSMVKSGKGLSTLLAGASKKPNRSLSVAGISEVY